MRAAEDEVDPMKHAGEGWFATEEYFPQDIKNPHVLGDILSHGDYYPPPMKRRR